MREILFRAKRKDNSKWIFGFYYSFGSRHFIHSVENWPGGASLECVEVDSTTVGQYTGLEDIKGIKIFEGDIVNAIMDYGPAGLLSTENVVIKWDDETGGWLWNYFDKKTIEVVGNIYDMEESHESRDFVPGKADR